MNRLARGVVAAVFFGFVLGSATAQEMWSVRLELADPTLDPAAVQVALVTRDPVRAYRSGLRRLADFHRRAIEDAETEDAKRKQRESTRGVAWDAGFRDVPGDRLYLLTDEQTLSSNERAGRRWVITKVRPSDGGPVCWCLPVEVSFGEEVSVVLGEENRFDLEALLDEVLGEDEEPAPVTPREAVAQTGLLPEVDELDLARIRELYRVTDELGESLWPGFDARDVPIAINLEDRAELLVGHPDPPPEYRPLDGREVGGVPVLIREGVSRFGPKGGGWAVDLGGESTVYVGRKGEGLSTERYVSLMLHEAFHVYQRRYRQRASGSGQEPPIDDPRYSALIGLESRILAAILAEPDDDAARELASQFVATRRERRRGLPERVVRTEGEQEYSEGTATYVQARLMQLATDTGGLTDAAAIGADYGGFADVEKERAELIDGILPPTDAVITFFHSQYKNGMAQGLVLDRLRPAWKEEMRERGMTQFALLERELPVDEPRQSELFAAAQERFGFAELLEGQERLVAAQIELVRGYLEAPGRRYRVYHGRIAGGFKWKPEGPVHHVPESLRGEDGTEATIWAGGIRRFERGRLLFESGPVPVIFRQDYIEWIDTDPSADGSDLVIRSERQQDDRYYDLELETDGFELRSSRARVEIGDDVVNVFPSSGG